MLTPIDIQNHTLKIAVRGYSKKETDDFLEQILAGYEELYKENRELKEKISSLSDGIQYYKGMESTLQKALVLAEKTSSETQEAAKRKAEAVMQEAEANAEALRKESTAQAEALRKESNAYAEVTKAKAKQELEETRNHVRKLVQSYENYRLQFKKLAESQIEMLESENYSIFAPELAEMLDDAPDADAVMEADGAVPMNQSEHCEAWENTSDTEDVDLGDTKDLAKELTPQPEEASVHDNTSSEQSCSEECSFDTQDIRAISDKLADYVNDMEKEDAADTAETEAEPDEQEPMDYAKTNVGPEVSSDETTDTDMDSEMEEKKESADSITPRLEDASDDIVSSSVEPQEESPFTFIDTE